MDFCRRFFAIIKTLLYCFSVEVLRVIISHHLPHCVPKKQQILRAYISCSYGPNVVKFCTHVRHMIRNMCLKFRINQIINVFTVAKMPRLRHFRVNMNRHTCIKTWLGALVSPELCGNFFLGHLFPDRTSSCVTEDWTVPVLNIFFLFSKVTFYTTLLKKPDRRTS